MALQTPYRHLVPPLAPDDRHALEANLRMGQHSPVIVDEHGNVLDGHNRYDIIGERVKTRTITGLTDAEKRAIVVASALGRRNMTAEQKAELRETQKRIILELRLENPTKNTHEALALQFGVPRRTITDWLDGAGGETANGAGRGFQPKYAPDVQAAAIERVRSGERVAQVAKDLDVPRGTVSTWIHRPGSAPEVRRLKQYSQGERKAALERLRAGESSTSVAESMGIPSATLSGWREAAGIEKTRALPRPKPEQSERRMAVLELHNEGLGSAEIARKLGVGPAAVSKAKVRMGIAANSAGMKLWADVDHVTTLLEGTELTIAALVERFAASEFTADPPEIRRCISSLSKSKRTVSQLIMALKQRLK
jgi:transposase-like protein